MLCWLKTSFILCFAVASSARTVTSVCKNTEFQCKDQSCIPSDGRCDGKYDCKDKSDETHGLCRQIKCRSNLFTCMYGACVDRDAACNGVDDCVDRSDELLPRCRNETRIKKNQFSCFDGTRIPSSDLCDGVMNCPDGSDETLHSCAGKKCRGNLFQCLYGACVDQDADCNGIQECADGSDEDKQLCSSNDTEPDINNRFNVDKPCILPPYPNHGSYEVADEKNASPNDVFSSVHLTVTCDEGYAVAADPKIYCNNGNWSHRNIGSICVKHCTLTPEPSVTYYCLESNNVEGRRLCRNQEPEGTQVQPECKPNYYIRDVSSTKMICIDGIWSPKVTCVPECGRLTPKGSGLAIGGRYAIQAEISWHAGVYKKKESRYEQICGGSVINNNFIITAAHCFWDEQLYKVADPSLFAVAVAKYYRDWDHENDKDAQKSDVEQIHVPPLYEDMYGNFDRDIALVKLKTPIEYTVYLRPICLDFSEDFEEKQLKPSNLGKVAGWGYTTPEGDYPHALKVVDLPYVPPVQCRMVTPDNFRELLTSDKICAGFSNGTATLCKGDSGGVLAFPEKVRGVWRYYVRGITSSAPNPKEGAKCNRLAVITFTRVTSYKKFIQKHILN